MDRFGGWKHGAIVASFSVEGRVLKTRFVSIRLAAVEIALGQQATSCKLRATTSLARLLDQPWQPLTHRQGDLSKEIVL
jgi:hypothetical protein